MRPFVNNSEGQKSENYFHNSLKSRILKSLSYHSSLNNSEPDYVKAVNCYLERALIVGAPFDDELLNNFSSLCSKDILNLGESLKPKISEKARAIHNEAALARKPDARIEDLFQGKDTRLLPLYTDRFSLQERIQAAVQAHNEKIAKEKFTNAESEKKYPNDVGLITRIVPDSDSLEYTPHGRNEITRTISVGRFLAKIKAWEIIDDRQDIHMLRSKTPGAAYETGLASRKGVCLDNIDPNDLSIVISRDPKLIGECSTGQRWTSCFAEGQQKFTDVADHIRWGTLIAYLVDKDDLRG